MLEPTSRKSIDKCGRRFRKRKELPTDRSFLQAYRRLRTDTFSELYQRLVAAVQGELVLVSGRAKRIDTIVRKLRRESTMSLSMMGDVLGFRLIVPSPAVQTSIVDKLLAQMQVARVHDSLTTPAPSGYRGVHIYGERPQTLGESKTPSPFYYEVQVRTYYQHIWATASESFGEQAKEGGGTPEQRSYLEELSERVSTFEAENPNYDQFDLSSSNSKEIYFVLIYDKKKGMCIDVSAHSGNLKAALLDYEYREEFTAKDFGKEVVLLSSPSIEEGIGITHIRYFSPNGWPVIPEEIKLSRPRPDR